MLRLFPPILFRVSSTSKSTTVPKNWARLPIILLLNSLFWFFVVLSYFLCLCLSRPTRSSFRQVMWVKICCLSMSIAQTLIKHPLTEIVSKKKSSLAVKLPLEKFYWNLARVSHSHNYLFLLPSSLYPYIP